MVIYLITFLISIFCTAISEISITRKDGKFFFILFSFIAIIIPSLLAGFRNPGIGTDTLIYAKDIWEQIRQIPSLTSLFYKYNQEYFNDTEFIYLLINWIASLFGRNIFWCFFFTNLCVILPIYCALYDNRKKGKMWIGMAIFLLLYYNISLNLIRQSITLAFCIYSFKYLEQKKYIKLIIWLIIIALSHNTGIFYIVFCAIYLFGTIKNIRLRNTLLGLSYISLPLCFVAFNVILLIAINLGILPERYIWYSMGDETLFDTMTTGMYLLITLLLFHIYHKTPRITQQYYKERLGFIAYNKLFAVVLFFTSIISKWAYRISYYFNYPIDIILLPRALNIIRQRSRKQYQLILTMLFSAMIFYWIWLFVVKGAHETYPYKSQLLGI